jgi:serine/threonine protein kinase
MIVMKFINHDKNMIEMSWDEKFVYLKDIIRGLLEIHEAKLVHRDFHPGNILFSIDTKAVYLTDLGLSKPADAKPEENYGVIPYVAPEILHEKKYTKAADIYSFGVIMSEVFSGIPPFKDVDYVDEYKAQALADKICDGDRDQSRIQNLPPLIVELIEKCWDAIPSNRPKAKDLHRILYAWSQYHPQSELSMQIEESDKKIKESTKKTQKSDDITSAIRTSKLLKFQNLPKPKNSIRINSQGITYFTNNWISIKILTFRYYFRFFKENRFFFKFIRTRVN